MLVKSIAKIREDFPRVYKSTYLDNAGIGACCRQVYQAFLDYSQDYARKQLGVESDLEKWKDKILHSKRLFARLIGADDEEVFFVPTTTTGLNLVANMLNDGHRSNVVTNDMEYFSNVIVWLKQKEKGMDVRIVKNKNWEISEDDIRLAVDDNTVALTVGQVGWFNGFRHDLSALSEIVHEKGAHLIVDGIQSVGGMKTDVKKDGIDFLVAGTYKWLLGPGGAAFLFVRKELAEELNPVFVYGQCLKEGVVEKNLYDEFDLYELSYGDLARRHDMVVFNRAAYAGSEVSMNLLLDYGIENIENRINGLCKYLVNELLNLGFELQSPLSSKRRFGIVNFKVQDNKSAAKKLEEKNVLVAARIGGLRVSPHFFNTKSDVSRLIEELQALRIS